MDKKRIKLILDLDGVLITTPLWKADEMDSDGYSKFNQSCIDNLNELLSLADFDIWLSSTRRTVKSIEEFNVSIKVFSVSILLAELSNCTAYRAFSDYIFF